MGGFATPLGNRQSSRKGQIWTDFKGNMPCPEAPSVFSAVSGDPLRIGEKSGVWPAWCGYWRRTRCDVATRRLPKTQCTRTRRRPIDGRRVDTESRPQGSGGRARTVPVQHDAEHELSRQDFATDAGQRDKESPHSAGGIAGRSREDNGGRRPERRYRYCYKQLALGEGHLDRREEDTVRADGDRDDVGTGRDIGFGAQSFPLRLFSPL